MCVCVCVCVCVYADSHAIDREGDRLRQSHRERLEHRAGNRHCERRRKDQESVARWSRRTGV